MTDGAAEIAGTVALSTGVAATGLVVAKTVGVLIGTGFNSKE